MAAEAGMRRGKRMVFFSDTHIGSPNFTREREDLFYDFLEQGIDDDVDAMYLVGDGFDLILKEWRDIVSDKKLVGRLNEAGEKTDFHVLVGNHDIGLDHIVDFGRVFPHLELQGATEKTIVLREKVGNEFSPKAAIETLSSGRHIRPYGKDIIVAHGYEFDHYFSGDPKRYDTVIRMAGNLRNIVGNHVDTRLLQFWEAIRDGLGADPDMQGNKKELLLAARDAALYRPEEGEVVRRPSPLHAVIFGHTHHQAKQKLHDEVREERNMIRTWYVNTGCWIDNGRYRGSDFTVLYKNGQIRNYKWENLRA
ncbi:MAG: metallophosphoesterase [Candidatus Aenigmarchaeota archaeon]|nr:metallophosphoesterase [Candidatus Aenigmarchaeota archaeon]